MKKLIAIVILLSAAAFGQGTRFDGSPVLSARGTPVPNVIVTVCTSTATGIPCSPAATTFTDATLTSSCSAGVQVTLTGTNVCQGTSDALGNYGFWVAAGNYRYSLSGPGITGKIYDLTVGTSSSTATVANLTRDCRIDGMVSNGVTDDSAAVNTCIANAITNGQGIIQLPCGRTVWTAATINLTNRPGMRMKGCGYRPDISNSTVGNFTQVICNQGAFTTTGSDHICIDTTGSQGIEIDHMDINLFFSGFPNGASIGILMSRDNAAGGGAGAFCFEENFNIHEVYITDNGASAPTLNSGRGFIGIYNAAAENGLFNNIQILADTPMLFSQNNIIGTVSPYQTILTGCVNATMQGDTLNNVVLAGSATSLPLVEANLAEGFAVNGLQCVGGNHCIKFENTLGSIAISNWVISGTVEQEVSDVISTSVALANNKFMILVSSPPPGVVLRELAANLTHTNNLFLFDHSTFASGTPFTDNVFTGTIIQGGLINIGGATSASNTTIKSAVIMAPTLTDAQLTFNSTSSYDLNDSTGMSYIGNRIVSATNTAMIARNVTATNGSSSPLVSIGFNGDLAASRASTPFPQGVVFFGNTSALLDFGVTTANVFSFTGGPLVAPAYNVTNLLISNTSPTIAAAGCGGSAASIPTKNGTAAFSINVGTAPTAAGCVVTLPTATNGWNCFGTDITTNSTSVSQLKQTATGSSATAATIVNFSDLSVATAPTANDIWQVSCFAR